VRATRIRRRAAAGRCHSIRTTTKRPRCRSGTSEAKPMAEATTIKERRRQGRMSRDGVIHDIERTAVRNALAEVKEKVKVICYAAQEEALRRARDEGLLP